MRRDETLAILGAHQEELRRRGVRSLALFGSVARDEARPNSDVDVLVEIERPMGLIGFIGIQEYLEQILGCDVDLGTPESLKPAIRDRVLQEAVRVT
jgi:predicted nucleotidyltransferase